jgi:hypothetical protein
MERSLQNATKRLGKLCPHGYEMPRNQQSKITLSSMRGSGRKKSVNVNRTRNHYKMVLIATHIKKGRKQKI